MQRLVAAALLTALSPVLAVVALVLLIAQGRPVLYRQRRPGLRERPFVLYKFRTMRPSAKGRDEAARITRCGRFLRQTSLDELPQLLNVLKGEMSLVGPRPLLMEYLPFYTDEERIRHSVRPGITGLAQVSGRHLLDSRRRLSLDVEYVRTRSVRLDLAILAKTVFVLAARGGTAAVPNDLLTNEFQRRMADARAR